MPLGQSSAQKARNGKTYRLSTGLDGERQDRSGCKDRTQAANRQTRWREATSWGKEGRGARKVHCQFSALSAVVKTDGPRHHKQRQ